jgi:hypothetical protein
VSRVDQDEAAKKIAETDPRRRWKLWVSIENGLKYARTVKSSPPRVVFDADWDGVLRKITESGEGDQ